MRDAWFWIIEQLRPEFADLEGPQLFRTAFRMLVSFVCGGVLGFEREIEGKAAGLRTHILVALGATLLVLAPQQAGMKLEDLSRVIQGIVSGIGFLGGGAILKLSRERDVKGLTTAAGIWMTAAVGIAVGLGRIGLAAVSVILSLIVLAALAKLDIAPSPSDKSSRDA